MSVKNECLAHIGIALLGFLSVLALSPPAVANGETALDRYIAKEEPDYGWRVEKRLAGEGYTGFVLELSSQRWRSEGEVDRPVWTHWLTIIKPDGVSLNKGLLYIGGGRNGQDQNGGESAHGFFLNSADT